MTDALSEATRARLSGFPDEGDPAWLRAVGLHRKELRSWAMYDWANSAFSTTIMAAVLPVYFHKVAAEGLPENVRTAYWAYTAAAALAISAVLSPVLGAVADILGAKKRLLGAFMAAGAAATGLLVLVGPGDWLFAAALFLVGNVGFAGSNVFYDALLPSIATHEEMDRVSTAGYALGYLGGGVLLALNLAWILSPDTFGFADKGVATRAAFGSVAVWWATFSWPVLKHVREPKPDRRADEVAHPIRIACDRLLATMRQVRRYKQVTLFLVAFWLYSDGIGTIIKMATIYGAEIGIGETHLIGALLLVQFLGIPATFAFGRIADRLGAKAGIQLSLAVYTGICILGYFMTAPWHFWVLAALVALVQGGSQALSRSLFATITPVHQASEFFSFISVSARFAGILGPFLFGVVAELGGTGRLSILFLVSFFVLGMALLGFVNVEEGKAVAREVEREAGVVRA